MTSRSSSEAIMNVKKCGVAAVSALFFLVCGGAAPSTRPTAAGDDAGALHVTAPDGTTKQWPAGQLKQAFAANLSDVEYTARDGGKHTSPAVPLLAVLRAAGVPAELKMDPAADPKMKNANLRLTVAVEGADGYAASFTLAELLPDVGRREAWLALAPDPSPPRLIIPQDRKPARWVRDVARIRAYDAAAGAGSGTASARPPTTQPATVRCAVIGGMMETDFWPTLADRFERETGIHVAVVASGPKEEIDAAFRKGGVDLIVMHASDTVQNLVADGLAADPQPWTRNDMVIVGPPDDPAGIKGEADGATALAKIARAKAPFVVHSSAGAQEVLRALMDAAGDDVALDPDRTTVLFDDRQRRVLGIAAAKHAYTLVGRIPFRNGKLPNDGLAVMVQGDPKLRRPFLVAVADPARVHGARTAEAKLVAGFLRRPETQAWIATFGKGRLDDQPLFFPVVVSSSR
jgi:tungstate transport system substrate-binding protein